MDSMPGFAGVAPYIFVTAPILDNHAVPVKHQSVQGGVCHLPIMNYLARCIPIQLLEDSYSDKLGWKIVVRHELPSR